MKRPDLRIRVQLTVSVVLFTLICLVSLAVAITTLSNTTLLSLQRGNLDLNCRMLREECSQDIENMYDTFYRMIYSVPIKNIYQPDASFDTLSSSVALLSESFSPNRVIQLKLYDSYASAFLRIDSFKSNDLVFPDELYPIDPYMDVQSQNATLETIIKNIGVIRGPLKTNVTLGGTNYMMSITLPIHNGGHYLSTSQGTDDVTGYGTFIFSAFKLQSVLSTVSLSSSESQIGSAALCSVDENYDTFTQLIPFNDSTINNDYNITGNSTYAFNSSYKQHTQFEFSDNFDVPKKMRPELESNVLPSALLNQGPHNSMISVAQFGILSQTFYVVVLQSHKGVYEMSDQLRNNIIISSCSIAAAMIVFTFLFVSFGARQILRLKMAATYETPAKSRWGFIPIPWWLRPANKVRMKGENEYLVPEKVPLRKHVRDELDDITERFNTISTELTKQYEKLERRVKDRKEEIEQAREAADLANAAKSHFLARVTHELRTPLNGIIGSASLCLEEDNIDQVHESLDTIFKCGELLLHLMTDLLSFSQNEVENLSIELRDFKMSEITSQLSAIFSEQCSSKNINLVVKSNPVLDNMVFSGDTNRILQVIFNLMSNGIKFTPPQGTVTFRADGEPTSNPKELNLIFRVKDNGPGIAPEMQHKVFEAFVQGDISTQIKKAGVGLGLSICRQLAERMCGNIVLKSKLNEGSEFTFTFPTRYHYGSESMESLDLSTTNSVVRSKSSNLGTPMTQSSDSQVHTPTSMSLNSVQAHEYSPESTKSEMFLSRTLSTASSKAREFKRRLTQESVTRHKLKEEKEKEVEKDNGKEDKIIGQDVLDKPFESPSEILDIEDKEKDDKIHFAHAEVADKRPSTALQRQQSESLEIRNALRRADSENYFNFNPNPQLPSLTSPCPKLATEHLRVLVVDDNNVNQEVIVRMLKLEGVRDIEVAGDGIVAVEKTRKANDSNKPFNVIFMDVQMPRMDGRQATKVIRNELHSDVRIVAVSAFADDRNAQECIDAGMNLFLSKPLRRPHLRDILQGLSYP